MHPQLLMTAHHKTISIGLETATGALEKFLASGDLPNHCIDVICTINRELKAPAENYSLQDLVLSFLDSKLLVSACDTWVREGIPPLLSEVILEFFFLVTTNIFKEVGVISTSLLYRNNHVLHRVCDFYQYFYKTSIEAPRPVLLEQDNSSITEVFVTALKLNEVFLKEFIELHEDFAPLVFFVTHVAYCYEAAAECVSLPLLKKQADAVKSLLRDKTSWGAAPAMEIEPSWKFKFFCQILQPTPISELSIALFHMFLELIESWQTLLFICIRLLKNVPQNSLVDSIVAESVNCRLALFGSILGANLFNDSDEMIVWCFLDNVLRSGSFDLVMGLFYEQCSVEAEREPESTQSLRRAIFEFVESSEAFEQEFSKELRQIYDKCKKRQECAIRLSNRRSLFGFFICRVQNFHTNSTRVNRLIRVALFNLCVFNTSHSSVHPGAIYREFLGLIEAIHYERPEEKDKSSMSPFSPQVRSKDYSFSSSLSGANSVKSFTVPECLDMEIVKDEGHKINMRLFESCLAIIYAAIKTRELRKIRASEK